MTPLAINTYARQQWNAVGDNFWSDVEIYSYIWQACTVLARDCDVIREAFTTPTVASQQEYAKPANCIKIKRITYEGAKLFKITDREDDAITLSNQTTLATGTPQYYFEWGATISLRPVPIAVGTLKIFCFNQPQQVSATSVLEVPERYHHQIADFVLSKMATKEKNFEAAAAYRDLWMGHVKEAKIFERKAQRGDAFANVNAEDTIPLTVLGAV